MELYRKLRLKSGLRKYVCELTLDPNTAHRQLRLSESNRKVTFLWRPQSHPDHPDRFDYWPQLLCKDGLTGRCYWEVEWRGEVDISVSYRRIQRKGNKDESRFGFNAQSWSLVCTSKGFYVRHDDRLKLVRPSSSSTSSSPSGRVGVYVDCPAGSLSFYSVSSDRLIHLHTFKTTFTEPMCPGFLIGWNSSVSL